MLLQILQETSLFLFLITIQPCERKSKFLILQEYFSKRCQQSVILFLVHNTKTNEVIV